MTRSTPIQGFEDAIQAWLTSGIIPIFSAGNSGPNCETSGYPGWSEKVIAVGATETDDRITNFSSLGPGYSDQAKVKPDISAPGRGITSGSHQSDTGYVRMSGTSMSCPLVSGMASLMLSKNKSLSFKQIKYAIEQSSVQGKSQSKTCGGTADTARQNNIFGYGRVDAVEAMKRV